jgi:competence protein ComFC
MRGKKRDRIGVGFCRSRAAALGAKLAELLAFPSVCRRCGALLENPAERLVCPDCWAALAPCKASHCPVCGRFFDGDGDSHPCGACLRRRSPLAAVRSAARYDGAVKEILLLFKYRGLRPLGRPLAVFLHRALGEDDPPWKGADLLVPVPLHRARRRERGFNQAGVLARELSRLTEIPVAVRILRKTAPLRPQAGRSAAERRKAVRGAFRVARAGNVRGRIVVLVDDVCTTGSTLGECARVLRRAGAAEVRAVTVARA